MDIKTERHEGDIVRIKDYTGIYVAAYDKTECKYRFCSGNNIFVFDGFEEYEVVGNHLDNKPKETFTARSEMFGMGNFPRVQAAVR